MGVFTSGVSESSRHPAHRLEAWGGAAATASHEREMNIAPLRWHRRRSTLGIAAV